ncbi:MAG: HEAT repeat domain-containing protein [Planctomycetota bacterium]|jgi:HEAT repeat protein|nr:HEAT repeat domain-containing protein [Planctomycetota bacterium]
MSEKSENRHREVKFRSTQTQKKVITVENDKGIENLPLDEKLKLLKEIEEMGDWRGLYEDMYSTWIEDKNDEVRRLSAAAFWDFPDEEFIDTLMKRALEDPDDTVCAECVSSLGRFIYEGFVSEDILEEDFKDVKEFLYAVATEPTQPDIIRCRAVESLSFDNSDSRIIALIEQAYKEKDLQWKSTAIFSMGRSHSSKWTKTILKEMKSKTRRLRIQAVIAAREGYVKEATPLLIQYTQDTDKEIRLIAISALPFARGEGAIEALEAAAADDDLAVVETAEKAIDDYFGLEDEEFSDTDRVDVRLGKVSDIEILDSAKIQERIANAASKIAEKKEAKKKKSEDDEDEDEDDEDGDDDAILPDIGDDDDDDDDDQPIESLDEGEKPDDAI